MSELGRNQTQKAISEEYALIGKNLKRLRLMNDLTQEELSNELGVSAVSIANYETGTRKIPLATLIEIAKFFGVSIDDIAGYTVTNKDKEHIVLSNNPRMISTTERWYKEVGVVDFTDDEMTELINFAKYIVHKRGN